MRFTAVITKEGKWYIAHCVELGVVARKDYRGSSSEPKRSCGVIYKKALGVRICRKVAVK
ncbi:hypothetical protein [Acetomicrobium sp.]|uniref:hypothetical protein n=1 Tax=Acetomicrobium sp. TaxID=1872099 RepID=UPI00287215C9|nr:hypothetical protein [Acetomicrobium sp.]MDR9768967.1 hypothetical protein [Acetomicrobium sp.]